MMPDNTSKYAQMLDELAEEFPELAKEAQSLQAELGSAEAPEDSFDDLGDMDFSEEEEPLPGAKKAIPSDLLDEEEDEEELY